MNTPLPTHIGGYQHLESNVDVRPDDLLVHDGTPMGFAEDYGQDGRTAGVAEDATQYRVYRKYPVAKQGDLDHRPVISLQDIEEHRTKTMIDGFGATTEVGPRVYRGTRVMPSDAAKRKATPIYSGFLKYFPRACAEVARVSQAGNDQHNPGKPLHWDRSKSGDELDALSRHLLEAGTFDTDGQRHSAKLAWRAMANLEKELEGEK